jgi:DNA modification methylase
MVNHYLIRCKDDKTLFEIHTNATEPEKREKLQNDYRQKHSYEGDVELVKISYKSPITYESYSNRGPLINQKKQFKLDKKQFTSERVDELRQGKEIGDPEGLLKLEELDRLKEILPECVTNKVFEEMYGLTDSDSYCQLSAEFNSNKKKSKVNKVVESENNVDETIVESENNVDETIVESENNVDETIVESDNNVDETIVESENNVDETIVESDNNVDEAKNSININTIYNMDCLDYLKLLKDNTIDMAILDPPYYGVVSEDWDNQWGSLDAYIQWFNPIIKELNRVSKYSCSCFVFGFPYQLSYLLPLFENNGFKYRQHICISKGIQSVAGRTSQKLKMFPTASEYILYFYKDARDIIKTMLQDKQKEYSITSSEINEYLGKASNGGGTWSTIAGKKQKNIQYPTVHDWRKLEELFGGFNIKYDDYVYKFNLPNGLTDVWTDINFSCKKYKNMWKEKYKESCSHPTMKPYDLIKRLIECSTKEGDIVLDIFMGTGMSGYVCNKLNRYFMGCELNSEFVKKSLIYM